MTRDQDAWTELADRWTRDDDPPPADLDGMVARRLQRATWRLWATVVLEIVIVAAVAGWTAYLWPDLAGIRSRMAMAGAWTVVVVAVIFSVLNRWGIWWPAGETTADYLTLCEERARRKARTARFVGVFVLLLLGLATTALALLAWPGESPATVAREAGTIVAMAAVYLVWAWWFGGRARGELAAVRELRRSLAHEPDPTGAE